MYKMAGIGCDPEVFITNEVDEIISGIGLIGGTKQAPRLVNCGAVQEDNVLGEFNTNPTLSKKEFISNITTVMQEMKKIIGTKNLKVVSSYEFTQKVLSESGPKAMEFGCDPDYNAWTGDTNRPPSPFTNLRTAGGHVHVSFNVYDEDVDPFKAAAMMDYYLGLPSLLLDHDNRRREMYGKAGACRPKLESKGDPYNGVEYRTLSNFWIANEKLMGWVFDNTKKAIANLHNFEKTMKIVSGDAVQAIINSGDIKTASEVIEALNIPMPKGV